MPTYTKGMQPAKSRVWEILWANKFISSQINWKGVGSGDEVGNEDGGERENP